MSDFDQEVEKLCRRMCEELGLNSEPIGENRCTGYEYSYLGWRRFEKLIIDWLEMEAFNKVRSEYWNEKAREKYKKPELLMENKE